MAKAIPMKTKTKEKRFSMARLFSWYSSDPLFAWFTFLQVLSFLILGVTLAIGTRLSIKQSRELEAQKELTAKAQKETLELRQKILRKEIPRWALLGKLDEFIKGKPTGTFEVVFIPESDEAHTTAITVEASLSVAGWRILRHVRPISDDLVLPHFDTPTMKANPFHIPLLSRVGGNNGEFTVISSPEDGTEEGFPRPDTAANAVMFALTKCEFRVGWHSDSRLPAGTVRIIVGPRQ